MKIGFAIKSLNVRGGGAERVLVDVANVLVARGHEAFVITFDGPGEAFYRLDSRIQRIDLDVGPPGQPTPRLALLCTLPQMRRTVAAQEPDVMVGFMHSMYLPLSVALLGSGRRIVASEHIGEHHYRARPLQRLLVHTTSKLFLAKSVPSEAIRAGYGDTGSLPLVVLPNPLDVESFRVAGLSGPVQPAVLLTVGRFMEQKNQRELIAAFARIAGEFPQWTLRIVGDGDMRPELEADIAATGMQQRILLPGMISDIAGQYAEASAVVVPSRYESFGLVTAEAQAAGRPVLGFADCPGTNELIRDGENGLLVAGDGDRVATLADGLRRLLGDAALRARLGAAGPASVRRFALDAVVDVWERFLVACASGDPQRIGASGPGPA